MSPNKIFYCFLEKVAPHMAKSFKKNDSNYLTYEPLKKAGHKFIYDTTKQIITHMFYKSTFNGYEHGRELVSEYLRVVPSPQGFSITKI